jgi:alpha-tubulin suppressor-like RCC1 family protein
VTHVSCGYLHTVAITASHRVFAFGSGTSGKLGTATATSTATPVEVAVAVAADGSVGKCGCASCL